MAQTTAEGMVQRRADRDGSLQGLRWRRLASITGAVVWLSFTLLYAGFWARGFTLFQSVIVILVSVVVLAGVMGAVRTVWGPWYRHRWD